MRRRPSSSQAHPPEATRNTLRRRLTLETLEDRRLLVAGPLDSTFGTGGKVLTPITAANDDIGRAILAQPDGKLVVAGYSQIGTGNTEFSALRYNTNGTLDTTFATSGKFISAFSALDEQGKAIAIQSDNKLVIAGNVFNGSTFDIGLMRLNANGTLDTSFGVSGLRTTAMGTGADSANAVAVDSTGRILVAGSAFNAGSLDFAVARYTSAGTLDTTYGSSGKAVFSMGSGDDVINGIALQADGKLVVVGSSIQGGAPDFAVARLDANGALDPTFDGDGKLTLSYGTTSDIAYAVAIQTDGRLLVGGSAKVNNNTDSDFAVARLTSNGALDTFFDGDGKATAAVGTSDDEAYAIALQPNGQVVLAGVATVGASSDSAIVRFNSDGILDTRFDGDGKAAYPLSTGSDSARGVALLNDGTIAVAGPAHNGSNLDFVTAFVVGNAAIDTSYGASGKTVTNLSGADWLGAVAVQTNGQTVAVGSQTHATRAEDWTVVRYNADGTLDTTFNSNFQSSSTALFFSGFDQATGVMIQPADQKILVAGTTTVAGGQAQFTIARFLPTGTLDTTFNSGAGFVRTAFGTSQAFANALALDSQGRIVVGGQAGTGSLYDFAVARYAANGTLDSTFGSAGRTVFPFSAGDDRAFALAIGTGDTVVLAGYNDTGSNLDGAVIRLLATGLIDTSFGTAGRVSVDFGNSNDALTSVAISSGNGVVVGGFGVTSGNAADRDFALAKLTSTGAFDTTFELDGKLTTRITGANDSVAEVLLQPSGEIIAIGESVTSAGKRIPVSRYLSSGALDTDFGNSGVMLLGTGRLNDAGTSAALVSNNSLIVAGVSFNGSNDDFATARISLNSTPTDVVLSSPSIAENQPVGTVVGSLSTNDRDASDTFTYALVSGPGSADNASFQLVGNSLRTAAIFNYNTQSSYTIRVRSTDAQGASLDKILSIQVVTNFQLPVLDINSTLSASGSNPASLTAVGSTVYFVASTATTGNELWKTDGTAAATVLVKDIFAGTSGASPVYLTNVNGTVYFNASDGINGSELWKSDGTAAGTVLVKDILAGTSGANPRNLTNVNGTVYFSANDGINGDELWKSDGTAAGTVLVKDIRAGTNGANTTNLTNVNGTLYFRANDGTTGYELWKSDGTAAGTELVKDIRSGNNSSHPNYLTNVNGSLFFRSNDGTTGYELWKSDGTSSGTVLIKDIQPSPLNYVLGGLTNVNGIVYFKAINGVNGAELWKSDGSPAGTVMVKDIFVGTGSSRLYELTNVNGIVYFRASDNASNSELWRSDGTESGTVLVKDIRTGTSGAYPRLLTNVNGTVYFSAVDGINGYELWKSDGTAAGTVLVKDIRTGTIGANPRFLTNVNGTVYFNAVDGINGYELWKSDGTAAGTVLVKDIRTGTNGANPQYLTNVNGTVYFSAVDGINGYELWKSDGTAASTVLVKDILAGTSGAFPSYLTNVNGTVYFRAFDGINGFELWKSDGTAAGTVLVKDILAGTSGANPRFLTNVNGTVYFRASDGINGYELWKSDGTTAGTGLVMDIRTGIAGANPRYLTNVNGTVYFRASDGINGYELWKSDGTATGTVLVKDIRTGTNSAYPRYLTNVNGTVYFRASDGINGYELWKSDGTAAGTVLVKDIRTGTNSAYPRYLTNVNGTVYFSSVDGINGYELWKSDGTAAGTVLVKDILAGINSANPRYLTNVNGTVYFIASDGINGNELWKSDGTTAGTSLVKDIGPGLTAGGILSLTNFNGLLYFRANDGIRGEELWKSDGTSAGTAIAMDINPVGGSAPSNLLPVGATLFFTATTDAFGSELYRTNSAPIAISLSNSTLDENSPLGSVIGQLSTADPNLNDRHAYTFVSGVGDTDNALFGIEGGYVTVTTLLDYETKPTYSIRVRSTDQVSEFIESTFTITVTDRLLEPLRDLNQTPGPINSSAPANQTIVGNLVYFTAEGTGTGIELWRTDGTPAGTFMVRDINAGELSSYPTKLTNVGGLLYFQANDGISGDELWKSDGTAAGTAMVNDVRPGASSPALNSLVNFNGTLFFQANDGTNGSELWKSNGTASGTVMVANIRAGSLSSRPSQLTNLNGTLLFNATDGTGGYELWKSDGTSAGTILVKDIVTGATSSNPLGLNNVGGVLLFVATTSSEGNELWKSDGTAAGTVLVKDIRTGTSSSSPTNFLAIGNTVYFSANDGTTGAELWKSDGTSAGTVIVKDARTGIVGSSPANLTDVGGTVYFTANDGSTGTELWKSNGTTAGTVLVKDIQPGANSSAPISLTNLNGSLFFQATDGITGPELWKSDGTTAGTLIVKDIRAGNVGAFPGNLIALGSSIVFSADDNVSGRELWLSDGTQSGSVRLKDIKQGTDSSNVSAPIDFNGSLFFAGSDGLTGLELWKTDGSSGTTVLVKDIAVGSGSSSPQNFTIVGSTLYFTADNSVDGEELWKTDGTAAGTVMVRNIPNGPMATGSMPHELTNVSGMLYFVVSNSQSGSDELWKSDGTLVGTDSFSSIALQGQTKYLTNVNGILYMRGNGGNGNHLWRTDGTSAGTSIVSPINPGPLGSSPSQLTNVSGTLFFVANDGTNGYELWKTNGTSPSTVLVKDIEPGPDSSLSPFSFGFGAKLTNVGGMLYFSALTAALGTELWKSDGTTAGTIIIADVNPGPANSNPTNLTNVNGSVYFAATNGTSNIELWKTDGTMSGTSLVKDINPGPSDSSPSALINLNGVLYMVARDDVHGFELWKSNGTSTGTVMIDDIARGFNSSNITSLTGSASALYFVASTQTFGAELYRLATNSAPQSMAISSTTVAENLSVGATVGSLSAVDPDAGDVLTFSLPNGVGDNSSFAIVGSTLRTASVFNFEAKSSYSITVRVTDAAGLFIDRPFTISVINLAELQQPVQIGDGSAQRSRVTGLTIDFDSDMIVDADAFLVQQRTIVNGSPVFANVTTQFALSTLPSGATRATLTFSGTLTRGGALVDGYYQLTILGAKVRIRSSGLAFDGDANGVAGGDYVLGVQEADNFFALYGDTSGDGVVGVAEFGQFRTTFGKNSSAVGYNQLFDYEGDNTVGVSDFGQFRSRFGKPKLPF